MDPIPRTSLGFNWTEFPLNQAFEAILEAASPEVVDALVASFRERQASIGWMECSLYPEVVEALEKLLSEGRRMGVCTSKPTRFATQTIERFGLTHLFEFTSGDSRFPSGSKSVDSAKTGGCRVGRS